MGLPFDRYTKYICIAPTVGPLAARWRPNDGTPRMDRCSLDLNAATPEDTPCPRGLTRRSLLGAGALLAAALLANPTPAQAVSVFELPQKLEGLANDLTVELGSLGDALKTLDFAGAQPYAAQVKATVDELRTELSGPLWDAAGLVPVYGSDVRAVRTLLDIVADLVERGLIPMCDVLAVTPLESLLEVVDSGVYVNLEALQPVLDTALGVVPAIEEGLAKFDQIGDLHVDKLSEVVDKVRDSVLPYRDKVDVLRQALEVLPTICGAAGPRTYMVVAQANCEIRSCGGFPGSVGFLTADGGWLTLGNFASMYRYMPRQPENPIEISDEERWLFGDGYSYFSGIMNYNPHFPRVCDMWNQALQYSSGFGVDGVIALDPVLIQNLLGLYGSVTVYDGTVIDGINAASVLMNDVYWKFIDDNSSQDYFFEQAADTVFSFILGSLLEGDMGQLVQVLKKGTDTRRLTFWMADPNEQAVFSGLGAAGEVGLDPTDPKAGIYLGNETWGKIDWWLDATLTATQVDEEKAWPFQSSGPRRTHVEYQMTNTLPLELLDYKNAYVFGYGPDRRQNGDMVLRVWLYAPAGGSIENVVCGPGTMSEETIEFSGATHMGLQVMVGYVRLLPGEELTVSYDVVCSPDAVEELEFDTTPLCHD